MKATLLSRLQPLFLIKDAFYPSKKAHTRAAGRRMSTCGFLKGCKFTGEALGRTYLSLWAHAPQHRFKCMHTGITYGSSKVQKTSAVYMIFLWKILRNWRFSMDQSCQFPTLLFLSYPPLLQTTKAQHTTSHTFSSHTTRLTRSRITLPTTRPPTATAA